MAGNSQRRGAMRKPGTKKGAVVGSGGQSRRAVKRRGPTPPAEIRKGHPAARRAAAAAKREPARTAPGRPARGKAELPETVVGRNPVVEALRAGVPATALYVAAGLASDERVNEAIAGAGDRGISLLEVSRPELDRLTGNAIHQGLALVVPPYQYAHPEDLLARAKDSGRAALIVAVDGVTDPRNLGAIVRSAAAFGAHGVVVPERRSAGMTASAWRTSAGTAARIRVARCTNLVRTLKDYAAKGLMIAGPGRRRDHGHRLLRAGHLAAGDRGRVGGPRAGPADPDGLRRHGVDPDGALGGVAERLRRRRRRAGRGGPAAPGGGRRLIVGGGVSRRN